MSDHSLRLGPKELFLCAPGTPAVGEATRITTQIEGRERAFLVRFAPSFGHDEWEDRFRFWTFFWLENTEEERIFGNFECVVDKPTNPWSEEKSLASLRKEFPEYMHRFWLSPKESYCLSFASFGFGDVKRRQNTRFDEAFNWGKEGFNWVKTPELNQFLDWTEVQFRSFCQEIMDDKDSDLHFLQQWLTISDEEKNSIDFSCMSGTWSEMHDLLTLVLRVATGAHDTFPTENSDSSMWILARPIEDECDSPTARFLKHWSKLIFDEFQPQFWRDHHLCAHRWRQQHGEILGIQNEVRCQIPTAHELIEAMLELRQWASGKIPDAEIDALLPPL